MRRSKSEAADGDVLIFGGENALENFLLKVASSNRAVVRTSEERLGGRFVFRRPPEHVDRIRVRMEEMNAVFADVGVVHIPKTDAAPFVTDGDQRPVDGRMDSHAEDALFGHLAGGGED